jgi:hypothetical protein
MVEFKLKVNEKQGTAYIPKVVRESLGFNLKLLPNSEAAAIYREGSDTARVIHSLERIVEYLKLQLEEEVK